MARVSSSSHWVKSIQIRSIFWSVFSYIQTEYRDLCRKFSNWVQIQENTDQKKLRIWTFFTQCGFAFRLSVKGLQLPKYNKDNHNPIFLDFTSFLENYFLRHVRNTFLKFIACILFALFANFIKKCFSMILTVRFMISE